MIFLMYVKSFFDTMQILKKENILQLSETVRKNEFLDCFEWVDNYIYIWAQHSQNESISPTFSHSSLLLSGSWGYREILDTWQEELENTIVGIIDGSLDDLVPIERYAFFSVTLGSLFPYTFNPGTPYRNARMKIGIRLKKEGILESF